MRDRREFIRVGGATVALGVTGCLHRVPERSEDGGENETDADANETDTGTDTEEEADANDTDTDANETEEEPEPASFSIADIGADVSSVEAGQSFEWSVTVRNTGGTEGSFESAVSRRKDGGSWEEIDDVGTDVEAGSESTVTVTDSIDYIGGYDYRLEGFRSRRFSVDVEERRLDFGEEYTTVELEGQYIYTREDGERDVVRAGDDEEFAFISVEAENPNKVNLEMPRRDEFVMTAGDQDDYAAVEYRGDDAYGEGGESAVSIRGVLAFRISDEYRPEDRFEISWARRYPDGVARVVWVI